MIQSDTFELVKVISNPDASGAILILETDIQNIQVEKTSKNLSIENFIGSVYKVSINGQKESYDLTNKIFIKCCPYNVEYDYINSEYFLYDSENVNSFIFKIGEFYEYSQNIFFTSPNENPLGYALQTVSGDQALQVEIYGEDEETPMLIYSIPILLKVPQGLI